MRIIEKLVLSAVTNLFVFLGTTGTYVALGVTICVHLFIAVLTVFTWPHIFILEDFLQFLASAFNFVNSLIGIIIAAGVDIPVALRYTVLAANIIIPIVSVLVAITIFIMRLRTASVYKRINKMLKEKFPKELEKVRRYFLPIYCFRFKELKKKSNINSI